MSVYYNKKLISGVRDVPQMTLAEYNALTNKPDLWLRTDAPESDRGISASDIEYSTGVSVKDKIDDVEDEVDGKVGNWTLFEVTTTGNVTLPNNYTEFMFEVQTSSGIYSIIIPKIVFDRRVVGSSWYMQGWLYNSSTYAYSFITKQDTNSFKVTIFQNGSSATIVERVLYYR